MSNELLAKTYDESITPSCNEPFDTEFAYHVAGFKSKAPRESSGVTWYFLDSDGNKSWGGTLVFGDKMGAKR